jgi:hypothetical protein
MKKVVHILYKNYLYLMIITIVICILDLLVYKTPLILKLPIVLLALIAVFRKFYIK